MSRKYLEIQIEDQVFRVKAEAIGNSIWLHFNGCHFLIDQKKEASSSVGTEEKEQKNIDLISSPMPGKIVKVLVKELETVKENQTLIVLSSMKMEYTLKAPREAVIRSVLVKEGENVSASQELVIFKRKSNV